MTYDIWHMTYDIRHMTYDIANETVPRDYRTRDKGDRGHKGDKGEVVGTGTERRLTVARMMERKQGNLGTVTEPGNLGTWEPGNLREKPISVSAQR
jgi:hypothetical protein